MIAPVGITLGDPTGIGPEVVLRALAARPLPRVPVVILGDAGALAETAARLRLRCRIVPLAANDLETRSGGATGKAGLTVPVLSVTTLAAPVRRPGHPSAESGHAAYRYVETAARLASAGILSAMVTAPLSKAWVNRAGFPISGHTELLQRLTRARDVRMMLVGPRLRVVLVTTHIAHAEVGRALRTADVARTIRIADAHLRRYHRFAAPRIAVAGLNPHAGEGGLFGDEETRVIAPAVRRACRAGVRASGPHPADSLFFRAVHGEFDAVVAMYHDQGLIPLKLLHFHDAVNVTLGLPIIRTSPDHGTAFEIAGRGVAHPGSMVAALALAGAMARRDAAPPRRASPRGSRVTALPRRQTR